MNILPTTDSAIQSLQHSMQHYSKSIIPEPVMLLLAKPYQLEEYKKQEYFCRQGGTTNKTGLLIKGAAKAVRSDLDSEPQIFKFFLPGDFLSADNPQNDNASDRDIIFTENSLTFTLYDLQKNIGLAYQEFPEINNIMLAMYMEEIEKIRKISTMRGITDAKERITYYYTYFGELDNHFNGKDIANFIGLQRETFSRHKAEVLKKL